MNTQSITGLWMLCVLVWIQPAASQQYFKVQEATGRYVHQKIARFPGGDLLIGDSSLDAQFTGRNGKLYLTRMDHCGQVVWSNSYERTEEYLELRDCLINAREEIFLYGSAYVGADELIFLIKLNGKGEVLRFLFLEPETVDHFTFSLDMQDGRLMAYGLLKGWTTPREGFIAVFDERLNFQWGKKFRPFASYGKGILTSDGGFLGYSGTYLLKFDRDGALQWAKRLETEAVWRHAAGPLEVPGGYIFVLHKNEQSFLYMIDRNGSLLWQSHQFPATDAVPDIDLLPDGRLLLSYVGPDSGGHRLCRMFLSQRGDIYQQSQLQFDRYFQSGAVYQSIGTDNTFTIAGNFDVFKDRPEDVSTFLMQDTLANIPGNCFSWETIPTNRPNAVTLNFSDVTLEISPTVLKGLEVGDLRVDPFEPTLRETCAPGPKGSLVQQDTVLECGEEWTVTLPSPDLLWEDGHPESRRILTLPGVYRADNGDCVTPLTYEFRLNVEPCAQCPVFLPNAFSPNGDGINDRLTFFSDCDLVEFRCTIYNRYGAILAESNDPADLWDGHFRGTPVQTGVYVAAVRYTWRDVEGKLREGKVYQDVALVR